MLGLRLKEGISLVEYERCFGYDFTHGREKKIKELLDLGYLCLEKGRIFLSDKGLYVSNAILTDLL